MDRSPRFAPRVDPRERLALAEEFDLAQATLTALAVPEIAFPLAAIGLLGLTHWLTSPVALAWSGILGAIFVAMGAVGLAGLPIGAGGLVMLGFAATSLAMEVLIGHGFGLHAAGAAVCLTLAAMPVTGDQPDAHPAVVLPVSVAVAALTVISVRRSPRVLRSDPFAVTQFVGQHAVVLQADFAGGQAVVCGQLCSIRSGDDRTLQEGAVVRVIDGGDAALTVELVSDPSDSEA